MWNKAHQGFSPQSAFDELKMSPGVTRMELCLVSPRWLALLALSEASSSRRIVDFSISRSRPDAYPPYYEWN